MRNQRPHYWDAHYSSSQRDSMMQEQSSSRMSRGTWHPHHRTSCSSEPVNEVPVTSVVTKEDLTVFESRVSSEHLVAKLTTNNSFLTDIKSGYEHNSLFMKVLKQPDQHAAYTIYDQLIWSCNWGREQVLCVPSMKMGSQSLQGVIINQVHTIVGHFGPQCTVDYIHWWYWWPQIHYEVQRFCNLCQVCLKAKNNPRPPRGLLHLLPIPTQPWQSIGMDFIGPFP